FASAGTGTPGHFAGEYLSAKMPGKLVHVPYKGAGPALTDVIAGQVQMMFGTGLNVLPLAKAGKLRALAVTSAKRSALFPELPTVAESGLPGYEVVGWYGLTAPAKTPKAVIDRLNRTINEVLPELRERYQNIGMDLGGGTAAEFGAFLKSERDKWARVVKLSGAKVE
ncbi:MAG: tripartite tricarboxylate transporter substrate-binding protein, partial [Burkholderiales bacterium]